MSKKTLFILAVLYLWIIYSQKAFGGMVESIGFKSITDSTHERINKDLFPQITTVSGLKDLDLKFFSIKDRNDYYANKLKLQSFILKNISSESIKVRLKDQSRVTIKQLITKRHQLPYYQDPAPFAFYTWKEVRVPHEIELYDENNLPVEIKENSFEMHPLEVFEGFIVAEPVTVKRCTLISLSGLWTLFPLQFRYKNQLEGVEFQTVIKMELGQEGVGKENLPVKVFSHRVYEGNASEIEVLVKNEGLKRPMEEMSCEGLY